MIQSVNSPIICAIGDVHGHLQLGLCIAARWQREMGVSFDAVLLCGDVGSFTDDAQLDSTTRRHSKRNPCELEFLYQWSANPPPKYLTKLFQPLDQGGLGLTCPIIMCHGNHEGFSNLAKNIPDERPCVPILTNQLPTVDSGGWIHYLPSGWKCITENGLVIGAIGGIEQGQRYADYHELAYIQEEHILQFLEEKKFDVLFTHQGPSETQSERKGSISLQLLLDEEKARVWFHGHSIPSPDVVNLGPNKKTKVVPLGDVAFSGKGLTAGDPGDIGWCWMQMGDPLKYERSRPDFWRLYRRKKWKPIANGQLLCPDLC
jgi:hypothetical protein